MTPIVQGYIPGGGVKKGFNLADRFKRDGMLQQDQKGIGYQVFNIRGVSGNSFNDNGNGHLVIFIEPLDGLRFPVIEPGNNPVYGDANHESEPNVKTIDSNKH